MFKNTHMADVTFVVFVIAIPWLELWSVSFTFGVVIFSTARDVVVGRGGGAGGGRGRPKGLRVITRSLSMGPETPYKLLIYLIRVKNPYIRTL